MNAAPSPFPVVPERIAEIIFALCQTVSMRLRKSTLTQAQLTYIVGRLLGIRKRFQVLVARIRAGRTPRERAPKQPVAPTPATGFPLGFRPPPPGWRRWAVHADKPVPLWQSLHQNTFAWLLPFAPNVPDFRDSAATHRALLLGLLADPEAQALLLASRRVGDSLRPLCWMLGIESSVLYPARPVPARPVPGAAGVDAVAPASAPAADNWVPDPVTDEATLSAVATQSDATLAPIVPGVIGPSAARAREGGNFFATT